MTTFYIRDDDDREINHHGCTIEVGEAETADKVKKGLLLELTSFSIRSQIKTSLLSTKRFNWRL